MSEENDDPAQSVQDTLKERLKSPFYASWLIAFCALNWRGIYFLLFPDSDLGLEQRLYEIDNTVYPSFWSDHVPKLIVLPLFFACIAVAVIPWLLVVLDGPRYRASIRIDKQRQRDDELRTTQKLQIARLNGLVSTKDKEIEALNASIAEQKHHAYLLLSRIVLNNQQLKMNLEALRDSNSVNISAGADDISVFDLATQNPDGSWTITSQGKKVAETLPY